MPKSKRTCLACKKKNAAPPEDDGVQICDACFRAEEEAGGDPVAWGIDLEAKAQEAPT